MLPRLVTDRLHLAQVGDDDFGLLCALNSDAKVMHHLTRRPANEQETRAEWAQRLQERSDHQRGLGYWSGWKSGDFVGWWGLGFCEWDPATANLGYRLRVPHWGSGIATEGSRALLEHAFNVVGLDSVWASTTQPNEASRRVLEKSGLRFVGFRFDQYQYRVTASEWAEALPER